MNIAVVTFTVLSGHDEKHSETIFKISILKVSGCFIVGGKGGFLF